MTTKHKTEIHAQTQIAALRLALNLHQESNDELETMLASILKPLSFSPGDTVRALGTKDSARIGWPAERKGEVHIICESHLRENGVVEYSTTRGAWYSHENFELVSRATPESLEIARKSINDEYDADEV